MGVAENVGIIGFGPINHLVIVVFLEVGATITYAEYHFAIVTHSVRKSRIDGFGIVKKSKNIGIVAIVVVGIDEK